MVRLGEMSDSFVLATLMTLALPSATWSSLLLWDGFTGADATSVGADKTVYSAELIRNSNQ